MLCGVTRHLLMSFHWCLQCCLRSLTSTQPSIPPRLVNRVPACLAWVKAGCVHLCRVAGNTVIPYGKWHSVALRWSSVNNNTCPLTFYSLTSSVCLVLLLMTSSGLPVCWRRWMVRSVTWSLIYRRRNAHWNKNTLRLRWYRSVHRGHWGSRVTGVRGHGGQRSRGVSGHYTYWSRLQRKISLAMKSAV